MDNNNRAAHGRFLNVKPAVGLLTSTARTFIQDGVTTEYATQVLGKTIDNGRLYAQLLTKSSRVVYSNSNANQDDNPNADQPTTAITPTQTTNVYNQIIPTQIVGSIKYDILTETNDKRNSTTNTDVDNIVTFIKNTDYISPNKPSKIYAATIAVDQSAPVVNATVPGEEIEFELLPESLAQIRIPFDEQAETRHSFSVSSSSGEQSKGGSDGAVVVVQPEKVKQLNVLPTFTIPSGYTFDSIDYQTTDAANEETNESEETDSFAGSPQAIDIQQNRVGKKIQTIPIVGLIEDEKPQLTSVTYYGFADFTTIVGNTVIVFSPSTAPPAGAGKVTSIKGEATLNVNQIDATPTVKQAHIQQTATVSLESQRKLKAEEKSTTPRQETTTTEPTTTEYSESVTDSAEEQSEEELEQRVSVLAKEQNSLKYDAAPSVIESSETQSAVTEEVFTETPDIQLISASRSKTVMLSIPSNEDISKIFASLAAKELAKSTTEEIATHETVTGATTIFFEDDPFLLIDASSTLDAEIAASTASAEEQPEITTDGYEKELTTTTTEEPEETTAHTIDENVTEKKHQTTTTTTTTTTETASEEPTTTNSAQSDDVEKYDDEIEPENVTDETEMECPDGFTLHPSTTLKTLTYLTTYFIPDDEDEDITTTSIQSNNVVKTDISYDCSSHVVEHIQPTVVQQLHNTRKIVINKDNEIPSISVRKSVLSLERETTTTGAPITTTTTEEPTTTENPSESAEDNETVNTTTDTNQRNVEVIRGPTTEAPKPTKPTTESNDDGIEIELIYKTLYTTYTYLTTFFHGSTSSISSRKEVATNVVTSTLDLSLFKSDPSLAEFFASESADGDQVRPTKTLSQPKPSSTVSGSAESGERAVGIEDIFYDSVDGNLRSDQVTPSLSDAVGDARTYYTTYTYYTTIFADGETEILSRTEVYTNFIGQTIKPTQLVEEDRIFRTRSVETFTEVEEPLDNNVIQPNYSTMRRLVDSKGDASAENAEKPTASNESVKKSNSTSTRTAVETTQNGKRVIENIRKKVDNILLEDQISSESNNEEIRPSSTLLLQTSFTTFTYYTTKYSDDTSAVLSRLETVTNVVTETLSPTQTIVLPANDVRSVDDDNLPTTYFTTFTYWTTLYKDGEVVTTSREKVVSNVISPTATAQVDVVATTRAVNANIDPNLLVVKPSIESSASDDSETSQQQTAVNNEPTTYFTTYTYFTTSYIGDETVLK